MNPTTRRSFVKQASLGVAGATVASTFAKRAAAGANDKLVMGLIGCGGRGSHVAELLTRSDNVEFAYVCDPDQGRLARAAEKFSSSSPQAVEDMRRVFDDPAVDAVLVATPNHWHAPASILACDAGKHVYVEKPCSHNIREGRLLVEAARRNNRVVQHGTQMRSTKTIQQAVEALRDGVIGTVMVAKAWNVQQRSSIGHTDPSAAPAGFNYDLWVGPVPRVPYRSNCHHGTWNWWYHFGTGDMGNDGVHDIDYARWGLGVDTHPDAISASGGKYFFDDDQEFPDTQQVNFEYNSNEGPAKRRMLIYEQRLWSTNYPHNCDSGVEFYGTEGQLFVSRRGKLEVRGPRNAAINLDVAIEPQNDAAHTANFVDCIRNGEVPNAEIEVGHLSTALCHLGNLATRLGRSLRFDPNAEQFIGDDEANRLVWREYQPDHWATPQPV